MWLSLRHSLATVAGESIQSIQAPGELMAKIGEVVAPLDNEYEYGTDSSIGSDEEYEDNYEEECEGNTLYLNDITRVNDSNALMEHDNLVGSGVVSIGRENIRVPSVVKPIVSVLHQSEKPYKLYNRSRVSGNTCNPFSDLDATSFETFPSNEKSHRISKVEGCYNLPPRQDTNKCNYISTSNDADAKFNDSICGRDGGSCNIDSIAHLYKGQTPSMKEIRNATNSSTSNMFVFRDDMESSIRPSDIDFNESFPMKKLDDFVKLNMSRDNINFNNVKCVACCDISFQTKNYVRDLEQQVVDQQLELAKEQERFQFIINEASSFTKAIEVKLSSDLDKERAKFVDFKMCHIAPQIFSKNGVDHTLRKIDEKDHEIQQLKVAIADMRNAISENVVDANEAEAEADELHHENEMLREKVKKMDVEGAMLKNQISDLEEKNEKMIGVQMELQMLKEMQKKESERTKEELSSNLALEIRVTAERNDAKAKSLDIEQQLAAVTADFDLMNKDYLRALTSNTNLQLAHESFQSEHEAELDQLEESRISAREAMKTVNNASLQAFKEESKKIMKDIHTTAYENVQSVMNELRVTEKKIKHCRKEYVNLSHSLDESIHRLHIYQEDVIDRSLIKNILLDWHLRSGRARREVMGLIASFLHFTKDEKMKCGIGESSGNIGQVFVGAVAPPLLPAVKRYDQLEGNTVQQKWVNFLLSESGDSVRVTHDKQSDKRSRSILVVKESAIL